MNTLILFLAANCDCGILVPHPFQTHWSPEEVQYEIDSFRARWNHEYEYGNAMASWRIRQEEKLNIAGLPFKISWRQINELEGKRLVWPLEEWVERSK